MFIAVVCVSTCSKFRVARDLTGDNEIQVQN